MIDPIGSPPQRSVPSASQDAEARALLIERIDALLPQTQCGKCSFTGCRPYAEAITTGGADINQCPPGGERGIRRLAALLRREYKPLNPANGAEKPREVAFIDEAICIGCTLCIQACPVDAILGASKRMHTVIVRDCTGCELCVAPCPVDCISMEALGRWKPSYPPAMVWNATGRHRIADIHRARFEARKARLERERREKADRLAARFGAPGEGGTVKPGPAPAPSAESAEDRKKAIIAAALARAKAQRAAVQPANTQNLDAAQRQQLEAAEARRRTVSGPPGVTATGGAGNADDQPLPDAPDQG